MVDDQYGIVVFADFRGDSLQFVALSSVVFADGFGVVAKTRRSHDRDEIVVRSVASRVRNEWKAVQSFRIVTVGYVGSSLSLLVPQNRSAEVFEQDIPVVFDQPADIPEIPFRSGIEGWYRSAAASRGMHRRRGRPDWTNRNCCHAKSGGFCGTASVFSGLPGRWRADPGGSD